MQVTSVFKLYKIYFGYDGLSIDPLRGLQFSGTAFNMFMYITNFVLLCLFTPAVAIPAERAIACQSRTARGLQGRATVISDGTSFRSGTLTTGLVGLKWQATGALYQGGCSAGLQNINTCYEMTLSSDPNAQLEPDAGSPRQRVEFLNSRVDNGTYRYTWRSYFNAYNTGGTRFFHTMQIFSATYGGPVYFTNLLVQGFQFQDAVTNEVLASIPVSDILCRPLQHTIDITYGQNGRINYVITDSTTGTIVMSYRSGQRSVGTGANYLKFGLYRGTWSGMPSLKAWYGDYTGRQVA
ncbi:uncharacterized protein EI90DRAFT_3031035 [Cantharellus anzutake]|uniref:uncharacterized protein n=1 Tax=Cantharellus anzutake TaxID=1750568 RepID=UPI001906B88A|nr:uncharacterized protein EI90DRAFT_3031035 [Cantharellus anzutake]KAF8343003.1 hypothetical protein EI90DRAFT_3031035 [Cantharellus anzutake]